MPDPSATWSRRRFLVALSAASVGVASGCTTPGQDSQDFGGRRTRGSGSGTASDGYQPLRPYTLDVRCELTEDYFLLANQLIDPVKDTIVAYSRADGDVEAIVLQNGVLRQYYRDPTQPGGWATFAITDPNTPDVSAVVAGMSSVDAGGTQGSARWLKVFWTRAPKGTPLPTLYIATEETLPAPGRTLAFAHTQVEWGATASGLQLAVNVDSSLLVAAMQSSSVSGGKAKTDARLYFWTDGRSLNHDGAQGIPESNGYVTGFQYRKPSNYPSPGVSKVPWAAVVARPDSGVPGQFGVGTPTLMLYLPFDWYDPTAYAPVVQIWAVTMKSGADQVVAKVYSWNVQRDQPGPLPLGDRLLGSVSVEQATATGSTNAPTMLVRSVAIGGGAGLEGHAQVWVGSHDSSVDSSGLTYAGWTWTELGSAYPASQASEQVSTIGLRPLDSGEVDSKDLPSATNYVDVFTVVGGVLNVYRQAPTGSAYLDCSKPAYTPAIPLGTDVGAMAGQAAPSTGDELLFVGNDGQLRTLTKQADGGPWSEAGVNLPAQDLQELDSYRVQLTLTDWRGHLVEGVDLKISADSRTTVVAEQSDGSSRADFLDKTPATFTTNAGGQVLLALLAEGVSAPTLTVVLDNDPLATVFPSDDLNTYFKGNAQFNYLEPISAGTLKNAQTPAGKPVFPGATDSSAADDAVASISQAATLATAKGLASAKRSSTLARRDGKFVRRQHDGKLGAKGLIDKIDDWSHDALHAIKKGAAKVKKISYDAEHGIFEITGDFEGWADQVVSVVVKGFEDAAHVIHAVFNKLAALIRDAIHWLVAEVIDTLRDTFKLADQYHTWLAGSDGLIPYLTSQIGQAKAGANLWLDTQQAKIEADFAAWRARVKPGSTMHSLASNAAPGPVGAQRRGSRGAAPTGSSHGHHHGSWLWNFSHFKLDPRADINTGTLGWTTIGSLQDALEDAVTHQAEELKGAVDGLVDFWKNVIKHPDDLVALSEEALLDAVAALVNWVFYLAKSTLDALLDAAEVVVASFKDMLFSTNLFPLPGLGQLLHLIGLKEEPSLGHFLLAVLAFPAVVSYKIRHGGHGYPFAPSQTTRGQRGAEDDAEHDVLAAAAGVSFMWSLVDSISSVFAATKEESPRYIALLDIAIPLMLTVLLTPSTEGKRPFAPPPFDDKHAAGYLAWFLGIGDAVTAAIDFYGERKYKDNELLAAALADHMLLEETLLGAFTLICSCVQAHQDDDDGFEYADAVFDSLPLLASPLLLTKYIESSEAVTAGVNAGVVLGAGIVSGVLYANESD